MNNQKEMATLRLTARELQLWGAGGLMGICAGAIAHVLTNYPWPAMIPFVVVFVLATAARAE